MSFLDFTLYPGGTFMQCESITEFDAVAAVSQDYRERTINPEKAEAAKKFADDKSNDPVDTVREFLGYTYEHEIQPLLSLSFAPNSTEEAMITLQGISNRAHKIADVVRCIMVKCNALLHYMDTTNFCNEHAEAHIGTLIKNTEWLRHNGCNNYFYQFQGLAAFDSYALFTPFYRCMDDTSILSRIFDLKLMYQATNYNDNYTMTNAFSDALDMMKCLYIDSERLHRLEQSYNYDINFDMLLNCATPSHCENVCSSTSGDLQSLLMIISRLLKEICRNIYNIQCSMLEPQGEDIDHDEWTSTDTIQSLIAKTVNIFILGTIYSFSTAYSMRRYIARRNAIKDYTDMLLNQLKTYKDSE